MDLLWEHDSPSPLKAAVHAAAWLARWDKCTQACRVPICHEHCGCRLEVHAVVASLLHG